MARNRVFECVIDVAWQTECVHRFLVQGYVDMHDTLSSLIERALVGNPRPLEFYLREHSRLPGPHANTELADDMSQLLCAAIPKYADSVRSLVNYFANDDRNQIAINTPSEFILFCGVISAGACAAVKSEWREQTIEMLNHYACSTHWRIREGVTLGYQHLLTADMQAIIPYLMRTASVGNLLQQCAAITAIAEPRLLFSPASIADGLILQRVVLENLHCVPAADRKLEDFKVLRRALGYTLSVITAASPEQGFALMRECAMWHDADINWLLRENLKKKRLARFPHDTKVVSELLS